MKDKILSAKNWYLKHERTILVSALVVTTTTTYLAMTGAKSLNQFLKDHDLYEEYYTMPE